MKKVTIEQKLANLRAQGWTLEKAKEMLVEFPENKEVQKIIELLETENQ